MYGTDDIEETKREILTNSHTNNPQIRHLAGERPSNAPASLTHPQLTMNQASQPIQQSHRVPRNYTGEAMGFF